MPLAPFGLGRGAIRWGEKPPESASRETCPHTTTERANGVFRNRQVGFVHTHTPGLVSPIAHRKGRP